MISESIADSDSDGADRVFEKQEPSSEIFNEGDTQSRLKPRLGALAKDIRGQLENAGFEDKYIEVEEYLNLRYDGTDTSVMTRRPSEGWVDQKDYERSYKQE